MSTDTEETGPGETPRREEKTPEETPVDENYDLGFLSEVSVTATVELGRTQLPIREVLKLRRGSVLELDRLVGQPVDLLINQIPLARGEVIVINERFGFRISKFLTVPGRDA